MRRIMFVVTLLLAAGCRGAQPPAGERQRLAASDAVTVLQDDSSPYRIIYHPPVDLAKKAAR